MTIPNIVQNSSTAEVIDIITQIIDLYDDTGPDHVGSPYTATLKLNEIALDIGVSTIETVETATNAMLKINAIGLALEEGGGVPAVPSGFQLLKGRDGLYLKGRDGAYLYGRAA